MTDNDQTERAAYAAGWIAAREAAAEYADREEAYSSKRANTDNHHDQVWYSSSEATAGSIASHIRALTPPASYAAALEAVRREPWDVLREAAEILRQRLGEETNASRTLRIHAEVAEAAAIRARGEEGGR